MGACDLESIPRHSTYTIKPHDDGDGSFLRMRSENAGSGLLLSEPFDPRRYPVIEWRWRVDDRIDGADHTRKIAGNKATIKTSHFVYESK